MLSTASPTQSYSPSRLMRVPIAILLSVACLWAMWLAVRIGFSRTLSGYGSAVSELSAVNQALQVTPNDPEARAARGLLLSQRGEYGDAVVEFERAAELRPRDYYLWLELGMAREETGDRLGSERALRESVRLAPYYARPAWQLGNLLFRLGRRDEAFEELRRAAKSGPELLPGIIDLAWGSWGNAEGVRKTIQPQSTFEHLALARFFAKRGNGPEAVAEFRAAGSTSREDSRELVTELLAQKAFRDAREIWAKEHVQQTVEAPGEASLIHDGGFEQSLEINQPGFGWQVSPSVPAISLSLDPATPYQGAKSLRIDFHGGSNPAAPVVSQIILVAPNTHYRLRLATRTQDLVSGGLPFAVVSDATAPGVALAESRPFGSGANPWAESLLEFTTGAQTNAVLVYVRRTACTTEPCPIFGSLWLDAFVLQ